MPVACIRKIATPRVLVARGVEDRGLLGVRERPSLGWPVARAAHELGDVARYRFPQHGVVECDP